MKELMAKHKDEMLQKWVALVEKYGAAIEEEKMYAAAEYIKELFEAEGFECELKDTGDNTPKAVVGTRDCDKDSKPVIFSGHYDTVFKSDDWNTVEIIDGSKLHFTGSP